MLLKHCYYLNLERREDRRIFIEEQLKKSKYTKEIYKRFEAIDGLEVHPRDVEKDLLTENAIKDILMDRVRTWGLSLTQGGLGVFLSYINLFKEIYNSESIAITFEDDVYLKEDFDFILDNILKELPEDFDLCYLGYGENNCEKKLYSENLSIPLGIVTCLPCLLISPKGAKKLLEILKHVDNQIDTAIYTRFKDLNVFVSNKKIVEVKNPFKSDIQGNNNCQKKYKKQNYIFSTLAHGKNANINAYNLALDLSFFKQQILIITDDPKKFSLLDNVIIINYPDKKFSYNDKIICFKEALKISDAVIFLDADFRICYEDYEKTFTDFFVKIPPGFHPTYQWGELTRKESNFFASADTHDRCKGYGELALKLSLEMNIDIEKAIHFQESILILSKENLLEQEFLNIWEKLASKLDEYEEKNNSPRIGVGEGNIIGLAVAKSGIKVHNHDWTNYFGKSLHHKLNMNDMPKNKKIVSFSESGEVIISGSEFVDFDSKKIDLSYRVIKYGKNNLFFEYEWNKNGLIDFLDHEFKIGNEIYHFNSDKIGNFYYSYNSNNIEVFHTYDWHGRKDWKKLIDINLKEK